MSFFCFAENGSEHFQKFVELLGEKVQLQNWSKFKGGLDTKSTDFKENIPPPPLVTTHVYKTVIN